MRYYRYLYLSDGLERKKEKIIQKLEKGKFQIDVYLVILSPNENNQLEIYQSLLFLQPDFPREDYFVVGIAKGYEAALEIVEEITKEVYNETERADIKAFILEREQKGQE